MSQKPRRTDRPLSDDHAANLARLFGDLARAINDSDGPLVAVPDRSDPQAPKVRIWRADGELVDIVTYDREQVVYRWGPSRQHSYPVVAWGQQRSRVVEAIITTAGRDVISVGQMTDWLCRDMLGAPAVDSQVERIDEQPPGRFWIGLANGQSFRITVAEARP